MGAFTPEEKKKFRMKKYMKEKAFEFALAFIRNIILTELVVWCVGSDKFLTGFIMALGFSVGWLICELIWYRKDRLNIDIKDEEE